MVWRRQARDRLLLRPCVVRLPAPAAHAAPAAVCTCPCRHAPHLARPPPRRRAQWSTFSREDACNYALNVYEEGRVLSVVVDAGPHGTHVAGIAAAHSPGDPGTSGVAPGARETL